MDDFSNFSGIDGESVGTATEQPGGDTRILFDQTFHVEIIKDIMILVNNIIWGFP